MRWIQQKLRMAGSNGTEVQETPLQEVSLIVDTSSPATIIKGVRELTAHAKPQWSHEKLIVKTLTGGTTNILLSCDDPSTNERILVRIYGSKTELFIDRGAEVRNMRLLHAHGLAPKVYVAFRNGICYGYLEGKVLDVDKVIQPDITATIARQMAKMHAIPIDPQAKAKIIPMLEHYLSLVPADILAATEKKLESEFGKEKVHVAEEIKRLKEVYESLDQTVVFCHNDLLSKNILLDGDRIHFIDYEYASANYQGFDIGNFFTEFGGQEGYDRKRYPTREWQLPWIQQYLEYYRSFKGRKPPTTADVDQLYVFVNKCALSSAILWGLWALIQEAHSTINFDFNRFAMDRLGMYFAKRDEFLSL
ncbi:ethanolamine kinase 2-like isoform X2 [Varroa jacobsoni]|uniref:ethanolamine kinase n=1 Tax=Varroa destructor TaxID=109461 RepID=A0A7M7MJ71_VARDE|nr:ethanolamine kinase 2-like isoform X2 [Varroa destructor]XP_022690494.1 ethanolamine kinase 2-like isoform X2 [Varroa jacobsoni]